MTAITDLALDLGQYALDNELEKGREERTQPIAMLGAGSPNALAVVWSGSGSTKNSSTTSRVAVSSK